MRYLSLIVVVLILTITVAAQNIKVMTVEGKEPLPAKTTLRARVYYEDTGRVRHGAPRLIVLS